MKLLIVINRKIQNGSATDNTLFGESVNDKGASELRPAWAEKIGVDGGSNETRLFDNIILNAADVDLSPHQQWTNSLLYARRVYATIN